MRSRATNLLCVLAALTVGGATAAVGCSGTTTNKETGGTASGGNGNTGGSGSGNGTASGDNGGDGGCIFGNCNGSDDGGINADSACAAQSASATLAKKPVDVIIIVDNSGSMTDEIVGIQNNINVNFADIIAKSGIDYRVILIAKHGPVLDESICIEAPLSTIMAGGCKPPPGQPGINDPKFFQYDLEIASANSWCRAIDAYSAADVHGFAKNANGDVGWKVWLRPDAFKTFIEITDDRVSCTTTTTGENFNDGNTNAAGMTAAQKFDQALSTLDMAQFGTPQARNYTWYSIVGVDVNNPVTQPWLPGDPIVTTQCNTAVNPGYGYQHLSLMTNGLRFPLCEIGSYDAVFQAIAQGVIAGSKVACDFPVPDAPMGQKVDLNTVEVHYTPTGMGSPVVLKKVADAASCVPNGFYLDVAAKRVYLCPDTCTVVQADDKAAIDVLFACEIGGAN